MNKIINIIRKSLTAKWRPTYGDQIMNDETDHSGLAHQQELEHQEMNEIKGERNVSESK